MNFKVAIYHQILEPKYIKVYQLLESVEKTRLISLNIRKAHIQDVIEILADIIAIKEKYGIDYSEDLELIQKYKK